MASLTGWILVIGNDLFMKRGKEFNIITVKEFQDFNKEISGLIDLDQKESYFTPLPHLY